ncbi:MAG: methylated-DNA--[protein]-cysteine S-methyltransferase [Methylococcales bacterium]|nr:methylated-DNA--[protein]-cysteine S-methyltransferase [Methylococcales bacterium]
MKEYRALKSPVGTLFLTASDEGLCSVNWDKPTHPKESKQFPKVSKHLDQAESQLNEYFQGRRKKFRLRLCPEGTDFQKKVWQKLAEVPYGQTHSYKDLAEAIGNQKAFRAVGNANGKNPLCVIIPCHRIIAANGKIGGYSGGLKYKYQLLELEKS